MKPIFAAAILSSLAIASSPVGAAERLITPAKLQSYSEGGQRLVMAKDPESGHVLRAGCTQGSLGFSITYGKGVPRGGNVAFTFQTKSGDIVATGVSLPQKGVASTQKSATNDVNIAKAFREIVKLGSREHIVMKMSLIDGPYPGDIGSVIISGAGSTKAMRPILQDCGIN